MSNKPKKRRVIDALRRAFPGEWHYDFNLSKWVGPNFTVTAYAESVIDYNGYSDTRFRTYYVRDDTGEKLWLWTNSLVPRVQPLPLDGPP